MTSGEAVSGERLDGPLGIDLVSPLPPVRSGIADYSADLLPALADRCALRVVRLPDQEIAPALAERYEVIDPNRLGEDGRVPLYQMGNNRYHESVWRLSAEVAGVLTLHDLVLHHFLIGRTFNRGDFSAYREGLEDDHGWIGAAAAMPLRWPGGLGDAAQFALPAHRTVIAGQRGVLTHSAWAAARLREGLDGVRVEAIPMGVPLPPPPDAERGVALRQRLGIPDAAPLVGTFGFQTPIKRTRAVLRAMASDAWHPLGVHLLVGGEVSPACDLEALAADLGIASRVHLLGFLPFDDFEAAIAAVDLCLNLRYPTAGETSASLLRILAVGKPAVVSDHAQSADLPDEGLVKVPLGDGEAPALANLAGVLGDRPKLRAMGQAARRLVAEHHRPAAAADAVVAACRRWRAAPPMRFGPPEPPPPTSLVARGRRGSLTVHGSAGWRPGERRTIVLEVENDSDVVWLAGERDPGGVALEVDWVVDGLEDPRGAPWIGLPRDLAPGARWRLELALRRPLGTASLRVTPHVFGGGPTLLSRGRWEHQV